MRKAIREYTHGVVMNWGGGGRENLNIMHRLKCREEKNT